MKRMTRLYIIVFSPRINYQKTYNKDAKYFFSANQAIILAIFVLLRFT